MNVNRETCKVFVKIQKKKKLTGGGGWGGGGPIRGWGG